MKKKILLALSIIVAIAVFVLVGGAIGGDYLTLAPAQENDKIYIGVFEPLTGYLSDAGNQELLGLEYARSQRPTVSVGGVTYDIEFVLTDNESDAKTAAQAAQKLINSKVSAVFGSFGCSMSAVGAQTFTDAGIPSLSISCTNAQLSADFSHYFRISYSDEFQGSVLSNFAYGTGFRSAAVVTQAGDSYSKGISQFFSEGFEAQGGRVISFSFNSVQQNFEDLVEEIRRSGADCVFMPSAVSSGIVFISQARAAGLELPIIGGGSWDTQRLFTGLGENTANIYVGSPFCADDLANEKGAAFTKKYSAWIAKSGDRIEQNGGGSYAAPVTALAFDAYTILCNAIEVADSFAPSDISAQLATTSYSGITGQINFNTTVEAAQKTAYIKTIDHDQTSFTLLKTYFGS